MRTRFVIAATVAALLLLPMALFAQASKPATAKPAQPSVTLAYHEDNSGAFKVIDAKTAEVEGIQDGDSLQVGWTVITGAGDVAELKLEHTSTIIKLSQKTTFKVSSLRNDKGQGQDAFQLSLGKIRTVAGKASGKDQFQIRTQSAVCGVRGSGQVIEDFVDDAGNPGTNAVTTDGVGWMQNASGKEVEIPEGFGVNTLAATFEAVKLSAEAFKSVVDSMPFTKLNVDEVLQIEKAWIEEQKATDTGQTPPPPMKTGFMDDVMAKLREILGMEVGAITISGVTYSKVVIQPTFKLGPLKMALYLPVIYTGDMFNPRDYYKPEGNDEWSFGTDQGSDPLAVGLDAARDVLLKIRYVEWGSQRDPFFFKIGNLNDITIGHGLIMRDFANDADFPTVRRVGVNLGIDAKGFGFEAMVNDAAAPEIFGGRLYIRPIPFIKFAIGASGLVDWNPAKDYPDGLGGAAAVGDPIFINPGVDLDLSIIETDFFSFVLFADAAVMMPYFRKAPSAVTGTTIKANTLYYQFAMDTKSGLPKNYGMAAGVFGNLILKDFTYRFEVRDYTGAFKPAFYNSGYERARASYVSDVIGYINNPTSAAYKNDVLGVFGEGGMVFEHLFSLKFSYLWPWSFNSSGGITMGDDDHFVMKFVLEKGVIPVVNIWGSVQYERTKFVPTILQTKGGKNLGLFDANTIVSAQVNYPAAPTLDVMLRYTTTAKRDSAGNLVYGTSSTLLPELNTTISIETQIHL